MAKIAVIYWSQTGNTAEMAKAICEAAGAEAQLFEVSEIPAQDAAGFDKLALGCPAMGDEVLEEGDFEPFFTELEGKLSGKKVALFGSYGWGDGQWMRDWQDRTAAAGAQICGGEGLIAHETPSTEDLEKCAELGKALAAL